MRQFTCTASDKLISRHGTGPLQLRKEALPETHPNCQAVGKQPLVLNTDGATTELIGQPPDWRLKEQ